jgi:hypothetical protein
VWILFPLIVCGVYFLNLLFRGTIWHREKSEICISGISTQKKPQPPHSAKNEEREREHVFKGILISKRHHKILTKK